MKIRSLFNVLLPVLALAIGACAPPVGGEGGNLKITLGGDGSRAFSDITGDFSYKLDFSGPGGETFTRTAGPGTGSLTVSVSLGQWAIRLSAYTPDGVLYGLGEAAVFVEGGKTNTADITVRFAPTWYVAPWGKNGEDSPRTGTGSEKAPFASVKEALNAIQAAYAPVGIDEYESYDTWPGKGSDDPLPARILVSGTITNGMVEISDADDDDDDDRLYVTYPPIILAGAPGGGVLDANGGGPVLKINNADVTLGPGLTLTGGIDEAGGGVFVESGTFTMTGGIISGNKAGNGGGVFVESGTFTMTGGIISDNDAEGSGGGVYVAGKFTMSGGTISRNTAEAAGADGGGVYAYEFTMSGGIISDNTAKAEGAYASGGGVCIIEGAFTISGGTISRNTAEAAGADGYASGGGVYAYEFTMSGGIISDNKAKAEAADAGGVYVAGEFTMSGGIISDNTAEAKAEAAAAGVSAYGGGVFAGGEFTMSGGIISSNAAKAEAAAVGVSACGGGVFAGGEFTTMSGGIISGNWAEAKAGATDVGAEASGGGAYVAIEFTMSGGIISDNWTKAEAADAGTYAFGGGVCITEGAFTISDGTISGNKAEAAGADGYASGGGVYAGEFTMEGGTVQGNTVKTDATDATGAGSYASGGGVYVYGGTFKKENTQTGNSGVIYGNDEPEGLKNTASNDDSGHAVYVGGSSPKVRNLTAGPGDNLDSSKEDGWIIIIIPQ
jgi:hypothetical protein